MAKLYRYSRQNRNDYNGRTEPTAPKSPRLTKNVHNNESFIIESEK